jgi:hypothetical protein
MDVQLTRDGAHRPLLGVIDVRAASPSSGPIRLGRATAGLGGDRGGAETLADELRAPATTPMKVRDRS